MFARPVLCVLLRDLLERLEHIRGRIVPRPVARQAAQILALEPPFRVDLRRVETQPFLERRGHILAVNRADVCAVTALRVLTGERASAVRGGEDLWYDVLLVTLFVPL